VYKAKIEQKIQFWILLAPALVFISLGALLLKVSPKYMILPLASLTGISLCWKWREKGFVCTVVLVTILNLFVYFTVPQVEHFWAVGTLIAMIVSCLIATLCFEETDSLVRNIVVESDSRLETLCKLDEKLKMIQSERYQEKEHWKRIFIALEQEKEAIKAQSKQLFAESNQKQEVEKEVEQHYLILQKEIENTRNIEQQKTLLINNYEEAIKTLEEKLQQKEKELSQEIERHQLTITDFVNREIKLLEDVNEEPAVDSRVKQLEGQCRNFRTQFEEKAELLDKTRFELFHAQERVAALEKELEESEMEFSPNESSAFKLLERIEVEFHEKDKETQDEINSLQDLINHLMVSKNS
jgi:hypothetical protein